MSETARSFPGGGSEFSHSVDGPGSEFGQDVAQVFAELDVQTSAGFHNGNDGSDLGTGRFVAQVKPVFASKGNRAHSSFAPVIVDLNLTVSKVFFRIRLGKGVYRRRRLALELGDEFST